MHIPDGFLDPYVIGVTYAVMFIFWVFSFRGARKVLDVRQVPLLAMFTAMFFAAQMVNFPIIGGTTAHLLGGPTLALTLGPYAGVVSMTVILLIQALLFGDGGVTTLGANALNMAVVDVFIPYLLCRAAVGMSKTRVGLMRGAFIGALLGDVLAAVAAGLELGLSVNFPYGIFIAVSTMAVHHAVVGVGEGIATVAIISLLLKVRPDLLQFPKVGPAWMGQTVFPTLKT